MADLESRAKVQYLYICMELYTRICFVWIKFAWPPTLFSVSLTIVFAAFVSIRYADLPFVYYVAFPTVALGLMVSMFVGFYELVLSTRDSEEILGQLRSLDAAYLCGIPLTLRKRLLKRAKALRTVELPVGEFADFSVTVPIALWDEMVNQVVFLLTL